MSGICVDFSVEKQYNEFCKVFSYTYQNEIRIILDLVKGKLYPEQLKDVIDFALLTFSGKIEIDTNPDSLSYLPTLIIGNIRDVSIYIPSFDLLNDGFSCSVELMLPQVNAIEDAKKTNANIFWTCFKTAMSNNK